MCVCGSDNQNYFHDALKSVTHDQVLQPDEAIIVVDGPVSESIIKIIYSNFNNLDTKMILLRNQERRGLAYSLNLGLQSCTKSLVARMDADDVSLPRRFEMQIRHFKKNPDLALLGTSVTEFTCEGEEIEKIAPSGINKICKILKYKNPFNHPSVMFNRDLIIGTGGYPIFDRNQDYGLWIKLAVNGHKLDNLEEPLVRFRLGQNFFLKRGVKLLKNDLIVLKYQRELGFINIAEFIFLFGARVIFRSLPISILKSAYRLSRQLKF